MLGGEGSPDSPEGAHLAEAAAGCAPPLTSALSPETATLPPDTPHTLPSTSTPRHFPLTGQRPGPSGPLS